MPSLPRLQHPLTDRSVAVRPFTLDDVVAVTAACQDPEISRWTATIPFPYTEEHARSWISTHEEHWQMGDGAEFAITRATSGEFLGAIGLRPIDWDRRTATAGYWVAAWARRQGVATRGLIMATRWAFHQVGLVAVELVTKIGNVASERVAEKAGFEMVGLDHEYVAAGQRFDVKRWELRPPRA